MRNELDEIARPRAQFGVRRRLSAAQYRVTNIGGRTLDLREQIGMACAFGIVGALMLDQAHDRLALPA